MRFTTAREVFDSWKRYLEAGPKRWEKYRGSYLWHISGTNEQWQILRSGGRADGSSLEIARADRETPAACRVSIEESDFLAVINGNRSLPQLLFDGKLKLAGDCNEALNLAGLIEQFRRDAAADTNQPLG